MSFARHPSRAGARRRRWSPGAVLFGALFAMLGGAVAAGVILWSGLYDVSATLQHLRPTYALLDIGLRRSVVFHSRRIEVPALDDPALLARGEACFRRHCEQCHGGPGVARAAFALGLTPLPSSLSQASRDWTPAQLYWITSKGIKMTGMPAWEWRLDEHALWSVVAYLGVLPTLEPERYRMQATSTAACESEDRAFSVAAGDPERGRIAFHQYACTACHVIPGIVGPKAHTGPPLDAMGRRRTIAGVLPNSMENMQRWLRAPHAVSPRTAMPDLGVSPQHAADMAAFLARLE